MEAEAGSTLVDKLSEPPPNGISGPLKISTTKTSMGYNEVREDLLNGMSSKGAPVNPQLSTGDGAGYKTYNSYILLYTSHVNSIII